MAYLWKANGMHKKEAIFIITSYHGYYGCYFISKVFRRSLLWATWVKKKKGISSKFNIADPIWFNQKECFPFTKFILSNALLKRKGIIQISLKITGLLIPIFIRNCYFLNNWKLSQGRVIEAYITRSVCKTKQNKNTHTKKEPLLT